MVVGVNDDKSVRKLKGISRPIYPCHIRTEMLNAIEAVDFIVVFDTISVEPLVKELSPDILVKGGDTDDIVGSDCVEQDGGLVLRAPEVSDISTTKIIKRLKAVVEEIE